MQTALRLTTRVQPGGNIEVSDTQLPAGVSVDLIVLLPDVAKTGHSIREVLEQAPGHLVFKTVEEVDAYIRQGRDVWGD